MSDLWVFPPAPRISLSLQDLGQLLSPPVNQPADSNDAKLTYNREMHFPQKVIRRLALLLLALPVLLLHGQVPVVAAASETLWKPVPVYGGAISSLGASLGEPAAVWAATRDAGLFRSLDGARTWTRTRTAPSRRPLIVGVDPRNGDRAFVMFYEPAYGDWLGLFFTTDGGATWSRSRRGLGRGGYVYRVAFDPHETEVVYAGTPTGLYRTTDGGRSWTRLALAGTVYSVAVAPDDPRLVLAGTETGIARSTDGGATFTKVSNVNLFQSLVFDASDPSRVYGIGYSLFRSTDRGLTWEWIARQPQLNFQAIAVGGDGTLYVGAREGVFRSTDGGATFTPAMMPEPPTRRPDDNILALASLGEDGVLAAGKRGVWRLPDGESRWQAASCGIRALDVAGLAVTARGRLLASVSQNGVFRSDDGGVSFRSSAQGLRKSLGVPPLSSFVPAPSAPEILYAGAEGPFRSDNGGVTWHALAEQIDWAARVKPLAVHPTNPDLVFAGGPEKSQYDDHYRCHALRSRDGGSTWECLPEFWYLLSLIFDPRQPSRAFAIDFNLAIGFRFLISNDGGETWREAGRGLQSTVSDSLPLVLDARGRLFVGLEDGRVMRSVDGGESFSQISRDLPRSFIESLIVDPLRPDTLYALLFPQSVFRSQDGGRHWKRLDAGLPVAFLKGAMALDAQRGLLFAGTEGRGLFVLDVR